MRTCFFIFFLVSVCTLTAQSVEKMMAVFPKTFIQFEPKGNYTATELKDGTLRVSRKFVSGEKELKVKLSASSEENLDENLAAIGQLIHSLEEMANQKVMSIEKDQGVHHSGLFTFISRQQIVAGALFLVKDRYMLEIEIIGGDSIEEAKEIFAQIDLTKLE